MNCTCGHGDELHSPDCITVMETDKSWDFALSQAKDELCAEGWI